MSARSSPSLSSCSATFRTELFALSSIMAIVVCAITTKYYVEEYVSQTSCTTIRHVVKMLSTVSETLIFFFLGVVTVTTEHEWSWAYILFTLLFAFVWRGIGILLLTQIVNPLRTISFNKKDQFGLAYGGLRGPSASLCPSHYRTPSTEGSYLSQLRSPLLYSPSSFSDEMKETSRPKKKFLTADVRKMHDLLAKNMYKIRHRTMAYTNKYTLPYHSETREILIRRHASIRRSLRAESFQSGAFLRSSSCSLVTAKKLNTIKELGSPGESPAVSANSLAEYPSVTILDERASRRAKKAPVPVPGRRSSKPEDEENVDSEHLGRGRGGEEPVRPPPLSPPGCLRVESREKMRQETHCSDTRHKDLEEQGDHD